MAKDVGPPEPVEDDDLDDDLDDDVIDEGDCDCDCGRCHKCREKQRDAKGVKDRDIFLTGLSCAIREYIAGEILKMEDRYILMAIATGMEPIIVANGGYLEDDAA
ncbi:hypothetical protein [Paracoccus ravus]|uniref:hypothetical protein n=1 Tax=Paracoccus ravus TaxID=2447760 RepID=UPI001ADAAAD4|nr:hypothetical protein [Paracoccus ravus]